MAEAKVKTTEPTVSEQMALGVFPTPSPELVTAAGKMLTAAELQMEAELARMPPSGVTMPGTLPPLPAEADRTGEPVPETETVTTGPELENPVTTDRVVRITDMTAHLSLAREAGAEAETMTTSGAETATHTETTPPTRTKTDGTMTEPLLAPEVAEDRPTLGLAETTADRLTLGLGETTTDRLTLGLGETTTDRPTLGLAETTPDRPTLGLVETTTDRPTLGLVEDKLTLGLVEIDSTETAKERAAGPEMDRVTTLGLESL